MLLPPRNQIDESVSLFPHFPQFHYLHCSLFMQRSDAGSFLAFIVALNCVKIKIETKCWYQFNQNLVQRLNLAGGATQ